MKRERSWDGFWKLREKDNVCEVGRIIIMAIIILFLCIFCQRICLDKLFCKYESLGRHTDRSIVSPYETWQCSDSDLYSTYLMGRRMQKCRWGMKYRDFPPIHVSCFFFTEMIQDRVIVWNANRNSYAIYRMVPFPLTLNDF